MACHGRVEGERRISKDDARREGQGGWGKSSSSMMNLTDPVSRESHCHIFTYKNSHWKEYTVVLIDS